MAGSIWPVAIIVAAGLLTGGGPARAEARPFEGLIALVVEPENSWGWDSPIFGALQERGFRVTFGRIPDEPGALARYDLVALSIKRQLTDGEAQRLEAYVAEGGAVYGSWGGPMAAPGFMRDVCKVARTRSLRLKRIALLESPLTVGVPDPAIELAEHVGHTTAPERGWEIVMVEPLAEGIPVAEDEEGNALGVLSRHGKGRTAVLGFGPEREKHFAKPELGPVLLDNLLAWLLEQRLKGGPRSWPERIAVALPARAEVTGVYVNGERIARPGIRRVGSVKEVELELGAFGEGQEVEVRIAYEPLSGARNVETVIHLPWNTLRAAAESPARLAEHLESLNATVCQPLLRGSYGPAWYRGMAGDRPDDVVVTQYEGDFLADLIRECRARGIKVIGGIYFDHLNPVREHPDAVRVDRQGEPVKDRYWRLQACFNNPKGQEYNLATVRHLLENYDVDGIILDDNFELDKNECYCRYCKDSFRDYCEARGMGYEDPAEASGAALRGHWREHRREATRALAAKVRRIADEHGVPAGGWIGVGMNGAHLGEAYDFLGGMVYETPPRAARGPLSVLGDTGFICLLWAPDTDPEMMVREAREAVHAGCAAVGFWMRGQDGGYEMDARRSEAIRQALGSVEEEWLRFYAGSILTGDRRFAVIGGAAGRRELRLRIRNMGQRVSRRVHGELDVSALGTSP